ncbi:MAG: NAD-dependent deacylase [Gemmatimonadota bacterium]|nr:NAD-dependent deacylase [Gemmatimonadota bacterium]
MIEPTGPGDDVLAEAREILRTARSVLVLTGAGISADSGVPTFRGKEGLWRRHRPEELATPEAFERDPRLVWEWYAMRRDLVATCRPNAAHTAIARWQRRRTHEVLIATQNVDGLHDVAWRQEAATGPDPDAASLLEVHGTLFRVRCSSCGAGRAHRDPIDTTSTASLPRCTECDGLLRPDVVWFGESLDPTVIGRAFHFAGRADVCLVIGTSALVYPAAGLPAATVERGGRIVEVNPHPTPLTSRCAASVRAGAARAVPAIIPGADEPALARSR